MTQPDGAARPGCWSETCKPRRNEASAADFPAQLAQTEAELTRAEGAANPSAWEKASTLWQALRQPYDAAYCRFRQGEALLASGVRQTPASSSSTKLRRWRAGSEPCP